MIVWPNKAHALRLATKLTPCTTGQVHLLVYIYMNKLCGVFVSTDTHAHTDTYRHTH